MAGSEAVMNKKHIVLAAVVAVAIPLVASLAAAGPIEYACVRSERKAVTRSLCGCIDQVAERVLSGSDQRRAAKFFKDPDEAHAVWISQKRADDDFWTRYKAFGAQAEAACSG